MENSLKEKLYREIIASVLSYSSGSFRPYRLSVYANLASLIRLSFGDFSWVGFYLADSPREVLYLGPFSGLPACEVIPFSKGVCGKTVTEDRPQLVGDVSEIAYHIACSSSVRSEITVPLHGREGNIIGVLDIDSDSLMAFDQTDLTNLIRLAEALRDIDYQDR